MGHRVNPRPEGGVRVELPAPEHDMLRSLPDQLRPILRGEYDVGGARDRLFPPAYEDPDDEAQYRDLVDADLAEERLAALEAFAETLGEATPGRFARRIELDAEQAAAWLSATNDARLVLASVVGIVSEEEWDRGPDPGDAVGAALWYLGWLQEELLAALSETDPSDGP
jgi:DNA-binding transcriptional ArsR family regulator